MTREKEIKEKMSAIQKALTEDLSTEDSLMAEFAEVQLQAELFEQQLQKKYPAYYRQKYTYAQIPVVQQIQQRITANDLVLDFYQLSDGLVSFWITKDNFFVHLTQAPELFGKIDQLVEQCQSPEIPMNDGINREVFDLMLLPGFKQLRNQVSRIYLIPEGELHGLPFAVLQSAEGRLLIEEFTLSRSYSSSLLLQEEDKTSNRGSTQFTGFATKYSPDLNEKLRARSYLRGNTRLEQLSLANRELDAAKAIFEGKIYLDRNASLENFTNEAPNSDILYLSLHGLVDYEDPAKSCIIFDDRNTQFILSAYDLAPLQLSTDLLVLSACHSASGKIYRGEGVKGMTRSFLASGVKSVVSSLWSATERSVFTILPTFLKFYADGLDKASALRSAQLDYLASVSPSRRHPYYWANLILVGHLDPPESPSYFWIAILCIMIVVGLSLVYIYVRKRSTG
jgi:CHAT domain-containing protein